MPYIHWETQEKQTKLEYFCLCKFIADLEPGLVQGFLSQLATENHELLRNQPAKTAHGLQQTLGVLKEHLMAVT